MQAQAQANTRVNYHNTNANTSASANIRNRKCFISLRLHLCLQAFAFHTCEPRQRKRKRKMKTTRSMPVWFKFKPKWRPSLISFQESSFPDCWSRVTRTLGTRLPPSWDTEMSVYISFNNNDQWITMNKKVLLTCQNPGTITYIKGFGSVRVVP